MTTVNFYYSIGSRYSYLAASQIARLEHDTGCRVVWHPLNSTTLIPRRGTNPFEGAPVSAQYEWSYREQDAKRWAALYRIPFVEPRDRVGFDSQLLALAATAGKRLGRVVSYSHKLFAAMFVDPVTRIDASDCVRRAEACGIAKEQFRHEMQSAETTQELEQVAEQACTLGVFGVPTFVVNAELFWGNDRLVLLRHHLRSRLAAG